MKVAGVATLGVATLGVATLGVDCVNSVKSLGIWSFDVFVIMPLSYSICAIAMIANAARPNDTRYNDIISNIVTIDNMTYDTVSR
jgi:hypothetical protein